MNPLEVETDAKTRTGRAPDAGPAHPAPPAGRGPVIFLICLGAVFVIAFGLVVWFRAQASAALKDETRENAIPTVTVIHPKRTPAEVEIELPGDVQAYEESPLYSRVSGYLTNWVTDIGARVKEGDLIGEIDTPELDQELNQTRAALAQADANLAIAKSTAERWQNLRKSDSVSQQDTDEKIATWHAREADLNAAKANVQRLTELIRFKKLVAPFAGIITVRNVDIGTLITAGSTRELFRLAKIDPLRVYISLPQAYSQEVKAGDEAVLEFSEMPGKKFPGQVVRTAGAIDPISRTLLTEIQVPNHDGKLFAGSHTMVRIKITSSGVPVVVPVNTLLFRNAEGMEVGVVESNDTVRLAKVMVGRDYGTTVEIVHGLAETDNVIVNPSDSLMPGVRVRVAPADKPAETGKNPQP